MEDRWLTLRADRCETADGVFLDPYYVVETNDWVHIVAFDEHDRVVLVRQYRHGVQEICLEIPAGIVESDDSSVELAARRELLEETGYTAETFIDLGTLQPNSARQTNRFHTFLALGARKTHEPRPDPCERIIAEAVPVADLVARIQEGHFVQAIHISSIFLALLHRGLCTMQTSSNSAD
ncbi:MAG: NUDIX hydrolase [Bdellovibrionales bacterium]|nr:NUDIX hydrolase [Bdellovibrionales bacterium]